MTRTQLLKKPEYYMEKLEITKEEALQLMEDDKERGSTKRYLNKEAKAKVKKNKAINKRNDQIKNQARKEARKVIMDYEQGVQFDNGSVRMVVDKALGYKIPHQTITAEMNKMIKEGLLERKKEGSKMMYNRTEG